MFTFQLQANRGTKADQSQLFHPMSSATYPSSANLRVLPLPSVLSKNSLIGAEIVFNNNHGCGKGALNFSRKVINIRHLTDDDISLLRQALFQYSVVVIRDQQGLDPNTLPVLAAIWDEKVQSTHSGELSALTSENNILSKNGAARIPRAEEVTILGQGRFDGYEGIPSLKLCHVVSQQQMQFS